jgi:hypothetical protein
MCNLLVTYQLYALSIQLFERDVMGMGIGTCAVCATMAFLASRAIGVAVVAWGAGLFCQTTRCGRGCAGGETAHDYCSE